jgi:hypothetical protein
MFVLLPAVCAKFADRISGVVVRGVGVDDEEREFGGNVVSSIGMRPGASRQCFGCAACRLGQASEQL